MYNIIKFNVGKFNINNTTGEKISGHANISIDSQAQPATIHSTAGSATIRFKTKSDGTIYKYNNSLGNMLTVFGRADGTIKIYNESPDNTIIIKSNADQSLGGESIIDLGDLILKPGDEVVIDTCNMTIKLNDNNAIKYLDDDSEFFTLYPGINDIIYNDKSGGRTIQLDLIWRDKWL